jgi:biotin carboxylase
VIKAAGLRSVHQCAGKVFSDVEAYLKREDYPLVLKPTASAGSDNMKLCHDFEEAKVYFKHILASVHVNGGQHTEILCQEFLQGKEYVIDTVSRDGEHKTMSLWVYDKRPVDPSAFTLVFSPLTLPLWKQRSSSHTVTQCWMHSG